MNIRPATIDDIASMIDLERSSPTAGHWTEQQYHKMFQPSDGHSERLVLAAVASATTVSKKEELLAFLVAQHVASDWELENIVVAPGARGRGLGLRLLTALQAQVRESNGQFVFLEVRESSTAARRLYEKAGFRQTGRRKSYYADPPEDAVLYRWIPT